MSQFLVTFQKVLEETGRASSAASLFLHQGNSTVKQFAIRFRTLASELAWNNEALVSAFWEGPAGRVKDDGQLGSANLSG